MSTYRIQATSVEAPQFSGSFIGNGSSLAGVVTPSQTSSFVTNSQTGSFTRLATGSVTASVTLTQFSIASGSTTELLVTGTGVTIGSAIADSHRITGSLSVTGSLTITTATDVAITGGGKLSLGAVGGDEGGEFLMSKPTTNTSISGSGVTIDIYQNRLRIFEEGSPNRGGYFDISTLAGGANSNLADPLAFSAPLASIASGGTAAETTITSFSIPAGVLKTGDNILYTVWGARTSGASTGVNSTLNSRVTDINGTLIYGVITGNRHHNYTLTARVLSDTSIIWWQANATNAAVTTTVPSLASSGFTINLSVVRNANTDTFTLYNALVRKYS